MDLLIEMASKIDSVCLIETNSDQNLLKYKQVIGLDHYYHLSLLL